MMCDCFFVIFKPTIGIYVLVFLGGYLFLSLLLYNRCRGGFKPLLLLESVIIPYSGLLTLLNFLFPRRDFLLLPFFFDTNLCGPTLLGFLVGCRMISDRITLSSILLFESTWLRVWWSGKLILEQLSYSEFIDKSPLPMLSSSKGKREDSNFVFSRTVISWRWLREQSIRFRLLGEEDLDLLLFLPLIIKPLYRILVEMGLFCDLRHLIVWRRLCLPDLQFCTSYYGFLYAQRLCVNLPAPLLYLRWIMVFLIEGLEIYWVNIFNVAWQTWTIDVPRCVMFFFIALSRLYD